MRLTRQILWCACYYGLLLLFLVGILLSNTLALVSMPILSRQRSRAIGQKFVHFLFRIYLKLMTESGILVTNRDILQQLNHTKSGCLIISNHPSILDAPIFMSRIPGLTCVFKSSLRKDLLLGPALRMLDYFSNDAGMDLLRSLVDRLKGGEKILIFPEGTRTDGNTLNTLNAGYAVAALQAGIPVHLVCIRSNSSLLSKQQHFLKPIAFPACFLFELGPTIQKGDFLTSHTLNTFVESWFKESLARTDPPPRKYLPVIRSANPAEDGLSIEFRVPPDPFYCHGHMPGNPLVPGFAQLAWIREIIDEFYPAPGKSFRYVRWKFLKPIHPLDAIAITLSRKASGIQVCIHSNGQQVTQGRIFQELEAQDA